MPSRSRNRNKKQTPVFAGSDQYIDVGIIETNIHQNLEAWFEETATIGYEPWRKLFDQFTYQPPPDGVVTGRFRAEATPPETRP